MIIPPDKVTTDEIKAWRGLHLLHFQGSTCSQKVRLILGELNLEWTSHPVNLMKHENATPWFLGINPRGVVPVLVHDGVVHVESNDIITYLDESYAPKGASYFFEPGSDAAEEAQSLLDMEDALHTELRLLTIAFGPLSVKSEKQIEAQKHNGEYDEHRDSEVQWWQSKLADGISSSEVRGALASFTDALSRLDERLAGRPWLMGERISIVDIAWFVNIQRLERIGYPLERHGHLYRHQREMAARPAFVADARNPVSRISQTVFAACRLRNRLKGNRPEGFL